MKQSGVATYCVANSAKKARIRLLSTRIIGPSLAYLITKSVSSILRAKKLVLTVPPPLEVGVVINDYASQVAFKILPYFKKLAGLTTRMCQPAGPSF